MSNLLNFSLNPKNHQFFLTNKKKTPFKQQTQLEKIGLTKKDEYLLSEWAFSRAPHHPLSLCNFYAIEPTNNISTGIK